jgi:hypothetical protein
VIVSSGGEPDATGPEGAVFLAGRTDVVKESARARATPRSRRMKTKRRDMFAEEESEGGRGTKCSISPVLDGSQGVFGNDDPAG